jgi:hypothetical protein
VFNKDMSGMARQFRLVGKETVAIALQRTYQSAKYIFIGTHSLGYLLATSFFESTHLNATRNSNHCFVSASFQITFCWDPFTAISHMIKSSTNLVTVSPAFTDDDDGIVDMSKSQRTFSSSNDI